MESQLPYPHFSSSLGERGKTAETKANKNELRINSANEQANSTALMQNSSGLFRTLKGPKLLEFFYIKSIDLSNETFGDTEPGDIRWEL